MKIIRHGYFNNDAFICGNCGCVFDIEDHEGDSNDLTFTELVREMFPNCPDCGHRCYENYVKPKEK